MLGPAQKIVCLFLSQLLVIVVQSPLYLTKQKTNNMKNLVIAKTFATVEDLIKSAEYNQIFEGYENRHKSNLNRKEFKGAYLVATDPDKNYGRSFDVYEYFIIAGLHRLMKIELGSSLDNGPMYPVTLSNVLICIHTDIALEKNEHNRNAARKNKTILY